MRTPIVVAGMLLALVTGNGLYDVASFERHAQWGDPTKRNATPRPQATPAGNAREQRNDRRPSQPFGALKK